MHLPGTQLWVRIMGGGRVQHPGVAWRFDLCKRLDMGDLILSYRPGEHLGKLYFPAAQMSMPHQAGAEARPGSSAQYGSLLTFLVACV